MVIYDIRKFFSLAAQCNPNICEVLWTDPSDWIYTNNKYFELIVRNKERLISKEARHTFSGYAMAQLKRINTHHRWLVNPPKALPTGAEYGLPERTLIPKDQLAAAEAAIRKKLDEWNIDLEPLETATRIEVTNRITKFMSEVSATEETLWKKAAMSVGIQDNFIELMDKERTYQNRITEWHQYQNWKATRDPKRAELEAKFGYDTKHAMHLVRLMRMCKEILETGNVIVKRPDREELLAIRGGLWTYEQLIEWASKRDADMDLVYQNSKIPHSPDRERLDLVCEDLVMWYNNCHGR